MRDRNNSNKPGGISRRSFMKACLLAPGIGLAPVLAPKAARALLPPYQYVGSIVALDPNSGAVLAMASTPTFDPNEFAKGLTTKEWLALSSDPEHPLLNRAISSEFAPGSTYKPLVALGALQDGVITPDTKFFCPGYLRLGDHVFHCWKHGGHGNIGLHEAIVQSCDVYFYHVGMLQGVDRLAHYSKMFGLGQKTGIDLPGESAGLIPTSAWKRRVLGQPWEEGETLSIAIGQGYDLVTPLQLTAAYAAIANNGKLWTPYCVYRIQGIDANKVNGAHKQLRWQIDIQPKYFQVVQEALKGVVAEAQGTAHRIEQKDFSIAGKTGTAQLIGLGRSVKGKDEKDNAWFVGYAPADNPQITVGAIVEHGGEGASAASPIVEKVMASFLRDEPPANHV
ncbi:MAG: penicillin-binding transpeptidase domain-containing protein [Syntrophobacteraceae bacterium]